eukprot:TRINITY_DN7800_c0_g1_i1.p1 TRINITY_DN7800_c0_g1~~TRINITY_DN7800_c0_g1_i1.p1  ORF type:complete len:308 (+),score=62.12 TRINITY_DN7800_c0_g1_i1:71-994(+)
MFFTFALRCWLMAASLNVLSSAVNDGLCEAPGCARHTVANNALLQTASQVHMARIAGTGNAVHTDQGLLGTSGRRRRRKAAPPATTTPTTTTTSTTTTTTTTSTAPLEFVTMYFVNDREGVNGSSSCLAVNPSGSGVYADGGTCSSYKAKLEISNAYSGSNGGYCTLRSMAPNYNIGSDRRRRATSGTYMGCGFTYDEDDYRCLFSSSEQDGTFYRFYKFKLEDVDFTTFKVWAYDVSGNKQSVSLHLVSSALGIADFRAFPEGEGDGTDKAYIFHNDDTSSKLSVYDLVNAGIHCFVDLDRAVSGY